MLWLAEKPREVLVADRPGSSYPYALEVADVGDRVQGARLPTFIPKLGAANVTPLPHIA
jgi:hypothetical protein